MSSPLRAPLGLTQRSADASALPSNLRSGVVVAVTSRGLNVAVAGGLVENAAHLGSYNPAVGDPVSMISFGDAWLVLGRPIGPGTAIDGATPGSAAGVTFLAGMVLNPTNTTIATSTGSAVVVPRYGLTVHQPTNHWMMLWLGVTWYATVVNDWVQLRLINSATLAAVGQNTMIQAGSNSFTQWMTMSFMVPPAAGGVSAGYYLELQRVAGTGTARVDDSGIRPGFLFAIDMGDASMIPAA